MCSTTSTSHTLHDELVDIVARVLALGLRDFPDDLQKRIRNLECQVASQTSQILDQEAQISALESKLQHTKLQVPRRHRIPEHIRVRLPPTITATSIQEDLSSTSQSERNLSAAATCSRCPSASSSWSLQSSTPIFSANTVSDAESIQENSEKVQNDHVPLNLAGESRPLSQLHDRRQLLRPRSQIERHQRLLRKEAISLAGLRTFTLFSELSLKLQQKIWRHTLPRARVIELCYTPGESESYRTYCTLPVAFQVCHVSRAEALGVYGELCFSSFFTVNAYMDFQIDTLVLSHSSSRCYRIDGDLYCCVQSPKIRQLAIDIETWVDMVVFSSSSSESLRALIKMECLETLTIVWDSARVPYSLGGSALMGWSSVVEDLKEKLGEQPEWETIIRKLRFGSLSRVSNAGKSSGATIQYLPVCAKDTDLDMLMHGKLQVKGWPFGLQTLGETEHESPE
jgi:2EXR family